MSHPLPEGTIPRAGNPPVNTGGGPDVTHVYPADAPGSVVAGWRKTDASGPGGWDPIDDAEGANSAGWSQV